MAEKKALGIHFPRGPGGPRFFLALLTLAYILLAEFALFSVEVYIQLVKGKSIDSLSYAKG